MLPPQQKDCVSVPDFSRELSGMRAQEYWTGRTRVSRTMDVGVEYNKGSLSLCGQWQRSGIGLTVIWWRSSVVCWSCGMFSRRTVVVAVTDVTGRPRWGRWGGRGGGRWSPQSAGGRWSPQSEIMGEWRRKSSRWKWKGEEGEEVRHWRKRLEVRPRLVVVDEDAGWVWMTRKGSGLCSGNSFVCECDWICVCVCVSEWWVRVCVCVCF